MTTNNELEFPLTFCLLPLHIVWGPTLSSFQPQSFCSRISSACGFCTVGVSLWIFCIYLLVCTWRLECCLWAFVIIFASHKILFSVYFLPIYSKNKLNKLIYLKTECFSQCFCGCTVNFVHCVWRAFCVLHFILVRFSLWWTGGCVQVCHTFPGSSSPTQQCTGLTVKKTEWPPSVYLMLVLDRFCVNVNRICYLQCCSWCALSVVSASNFVNFVSFCLVSLCLFGFTWVLVLSLQLFFFFFCICFSVSCICF